VWLAWGFFSLLGSLVVTLLTAEAFDVGPWIVLVIWAPLLALGVHAWKYED